jgi:Protein of unknown function (DUF2934)
MSSTEKKSSARPRTTSSPTPKTAPAPARARAPRAPRSTPLESPSHEDIERLAYELYLRDGCEGHALDHWLEAERELLKQA